MFMFVHSHIKLFCGLFIALPDNCIWNLKLIMHKKCIQIYSSYNPFINSPFSKKQFLEVFLFFVFNQIFFLLCLTLNEIVNSIFVVSNIYYLISNKIMMALRCDVEILFAIKINYLI